MLVTHESFALPEEAGPARSRRRPAIDLEVRAAGDAGTLTTKLVLTKDNPTGDVAFGVDNTFASRALDEGVFADVRRRRCRRVPSEYALDERRRPAHPGRQRQRLRQRRHDLVRRARPRPAADARRPDRPGVRGPVRHPRRVDQLAGLAFLLSTIAEYGETLAGLLGAT